MTHKAEIPLLPFHVGYKGQSIQASHNVQAARDCVKIAQEIGEDIQIPSQIPKANTLAKFNILARLLRTMDQKQINEAGQQLFAPDHASDSQSAKASSRNAAWKAFRDAVAQAGTPSAFSVIKEWVEDKKIQGEEAAEVIATLPKTIRLPTEKLMKAFFDLATSAVVQKQQIFNATALMAVTNFLRTAQVNNRSAYSHYPVHAFGRLASANYKIVSRVAVPYLSHQLKMAAQHEDSHKMLVHIRALGNLGHPEILNVFEPYLEGAMPATHFQRLAMVIAMDKLARNYPKLTRSVLFKIYQNLGEKHEIRTAAVFMIMRTSPPTGMLQRMAEMTNTDASPNVRAAVKSAIETAADLAHPDHQELAQAAKAAKKLLNKKTQSMHYSHSILRDYVDEELALAYRMQTNWIGSDDSILPKAVFMSAIKNIGGYKNRFNEYQAMVSSVAQLTDLVGEQFKLSKQLKNEKRNEYHPNAKNQNKPQTPTNAANSPFAFEKIQQLLDIQTDEREQLEGQILMKIFNTKRLFTFSNQSIEQIPEFVREAAKALRRGQEFNHTKFYNQEVITMAFPLATGFPFVYTYKTPTLVRYGGEVKVKTQPDLSEGHNDNVRLPHSVNITADIRALYSVMTDAKVGFITPFDHQRYVAGYQKKLQVNLPVRAEINLDLANGHMTSQWRPLEQKRDVTVFHASNWPYTARKDITDLRPMADVREGDLQLINIQQTKSFDRSFGQSYTGMVVRVQAKYDTEFIDYARVMDYLRRHDLVSLALYTTAQEGNEFYNVNINLDNLRSTAKYVQVNLKYDQQDSDDQDVPAMGIKHPKSRHGNSGEYNENNLAHPVSGAANNKQRQQQFIKNAAAGIANSEVKMLDVAVQFEGQPKCAEFVATIAMADSEVDAKRRTLIYLNANPIKASQQMQACATINAQYPNLPTLNFYNALKHNESSFVNMELSFGEKCQGGEQISIKAKMSQSNERKNYLQNTPLAKVCQKEMEQGNYQMPACQNLTARAGVYDNYRFSADFSNLSPATKNFSHKAYMILRHLGYDYHNENNVKYNDGKPSKVQAEINFAPNLRSLNASLYAPNFGAEFINVPVNRMAKLAGAVHPDFQMADRVGIWATNAKFYRKFKDLSQTV